MAHHNVCTEWLIRDPSEDSDTREPETMWAQAGISDMSDHDPVQIAPDNANDVIMELGPDNAMAQSLMRRL